MALIVNGEHIDSALIEMEMETMRPQYEQQFAEMDRTQRETQLREWACENLIERTVLQQEARRRGIPIDSEQVAKTITQLKEDAGTLESLCERMACRSEEDFRVHVSQSVQTEKLLAQIQKSAPAPAEETIKQIYLENPSDFQTPERVSCAHIVRYINGQASEPEARQAIRAAQKRLSEGTPFEVVAERMSDCSDNGGRLGYIAKGQMVEEFEDIVFNLGPGQVSDVFRTRFGYHIATVYDRQPAQTRPYEEVRDGIRTRLQEESISETLYAFIDALKEQATIEKTLEQA